MRELSPGMGVMKRRCDPDVHKLGPQPPMEDMCRFGGVTRWVVIVRILIVR